MVAQRSRSDPSERLRSDCEERIKTPSRVIYQWMTGKVRLHRLILMWRFAIDTSTAMLSFQIKFDTNESEVLVKVGRSGLQ